MIIRSCEPSDLSAYKAVFLGSRKGYDNPENFEHVRFKQTIRAWEELSAST